MLTWNCHDSELQFAQSGPPKMMMPKTYREQKLQKAKKNKNVHVVKVMMHTDIHWKLLVKLSVAGIEKSLSLPLETK